MFANFQGVTIPTVATSPLLMWHHWKQPGAERGTSPPLIQDFCRTDNLDVSDLKSIGSSNIIKKGWVWGIYIFAFNTIYLILSFYYLFLLLPLTMGSQHSWELTLGTGKLLRKSLEKESASSPSLGKKGGSIAGHPHSFWPDKTFLKSSGDFPSSVGQTK